MDSCVKKRAPRNRTIALRDARIGHYRSRLLKLDRPAGQDEILDRSIHQDLSEVLDWLPGNSVDLLFVDPPYNLSKTFNSASFRSLPDPEYERWLESWLAPLSRVLKLTASVTICGHWRSSSAIFTAAQRLFAVLNRITWEREKGRGSDRNWKNCSEDIWYCTVSDNSVFNADRVKLKRQVVAPYCDGRGRPRDRLETPGRRSRLTSPSNMWTDLTVRFWSMPENTDHPTQKPEKPLAKAILASSDGRVCHGPNQNVV